MGFFNIHKKALLLWQEKSIKILFILVTEWNFPCCILQNKGNFL